MKDLPISIVPLAKTGSYNQERTKKTKTIPAEVISIENMRKKIKHKNTDTES